MNRTIFAFPNIIKQKNSCSHFGLKVMAGASPYNQNDICSCNQNSASNIRAFMTRCNYFCLFVMLEIWEHLTYFSLLMRSFSISHNIFPKEATTLQLSLSRHRIVQDSIYMFRLSNSILFVSKYF